MGEKVCQTCGDRGWPHAMLVCCKCLTFAEHTYCIGKLAETDEGEIAWICEFCEPRIIEVSDSSEISRSSYQETPQTFKEFKGVQDTEEPRCKLISEEGKTQNARDRHACPSVNKSVSSSRDMHSPDIDSKTAQEVEGSHCGSHGISPVTAEDFYDAVQPLPDPIWMGGFRILCEYSCTVSGILAHMSDEATEEASVVASSLPVLLRLRMVPKTNIWPIKFKKIGPTVDNVAVYFFPENYQVERLYDCLVDGMIEHELAMVARVNSVELLIFSSRELPENSWRFQRKYYLWGMFRRKKKTSPQDESNDNPSNQHGSIDCTCPSVLSTEAKSIKDSGSSFP